MGIFLKFLSSFKNEKLDQNEEIFYLDSNFPSLISETSENNASKVLNIKRTRPEYDLEENDINKNKKFKSRTEIEITNRISNLEQEVKKLNQRLDLIENKIIIKDDYSYEILSPDLRGIICYPPKGVRELTFELVFKNNGKKDWPENTKLIIDRKNTNFLTNFTEINLGFLGVGEEKKIKIYIDLVGKLEEKKYQFVLNFFVQNEVIKPKIYINFQVKDNTVSDFRNLYEISENIASNTFVKREIEKNNGDFPKTYNNILWKSVNNLKENPKKKN